MQVPILVNAMVVNKKTKKIYDDSFIINYYNRDICNTPDMMLISTIINTNLLDDSSFVLDVTSVVDIISKRYLYLEVSEDYFKV